MVSNSTDTRSPEVVEPSTEPMASSILECTERTDSTSVAPTAAANDAAADANRRFSRLLVPAALLAIIVTATIVAYSGVLFDFFLGDDFGHLTWLKVAIAQPDLIWKNFYSSWLDGTTTRFYRPLISIFMVSDYLLWGANGLGFHITNLLFHIASTVLIFFIAQNLLTATRSTSGGNSDAIRTWLYPFSASLIFGLYPLHTEAVSWITGRVDVIVTAFYLASFWCYMNWRRPGPQDKVGNSNSSSTSKHLWLAGTTAAMILGLLSKEMAVTLPALFIMYELVFNPRGAKNLSILLATALKSTSIFWLVIVAYFALRRHALGTFVGGYDDSLFFVPDVRAFIDTWIHGLRMFIIPLNKSLIGAHHILTRLWEIHLALLAVTFAAALWQDKHLARLLFFNLSFLAIAFVPVYKVFNIADDLQGNRLAHVATVALSLLIAMCFIAPLRKAISQIAGAASQNREPRAPHLQPFTLWQATLATSYAVLCFAVLWTNNQAWASAGREAGAIRAGLDKLYTNVDGDPQVLLIGLPDTIDGAYIMRNALAGMTRTPQMHRDAFHCLMLNQFEQTIPFGFLKESLRQAGDDAKVFWWNSGTGSFEQARIVNAQSQTNPQTNTSSWSGASLKQVIVDQNGRFLPDGSFEVVATNGRFARPEVNLDFGERSSFDINFVSIKLRDLGGDRSNFQKQGADLLYSHRITNDFSLPKRTHGNLSSDLARQEVILPLRSLPEWALRGTAGKLKLLLPRNSHLAIESISILDPAQLIPSVSFEKSGFLGRKGEIHLSKRKGEAQPSKPTADTKDTVGLGKPGTLPGDSTVSVDATKIPGASSVVLELTRGNLYFEFQNTPQPSKVIMTELRAPIKGSITFRRDMFPSAGIYEARAWAVDKDNKKLGVAGDHIVLSIDD